jgi:hypothetical protein
LIVALVFKMSSPALTVNVAELDPAGTTTLAEVNTAEVVVSVTKTPPAGAGPFRLTVPTAVIPDGIVFGDTVSPTNVSGCIAKVAVIVAPPSLAEIVEFVLDETVNVVTVNVAELEPADTVTLAGVAALKLVELRLTNAPPVGAGPVRDTVPVDEDPPVTELGERDTEASAGGLIVSIVFAEPPKSEPVIVADAAAETAEVDTVKVAEPAPPGIVMLTGTVANELVEERLMTMPPVGAAPLKETVPTEEAPPITEVGETERPEIAGGVRVRVAFADEPWRVPVIVAETDDATADVEIENVALVEPAETVTVAGTTALVLLEVKLTAIPPEGAIPLRVTVPVEEAPPVSEVGDTESPETVGGFTVSVALRVAPFNVPDIVAAVDIETAVVLILNGAFVAPAATNTLAGTTTLALPDDRLTEAPPVGAGPLRVTMPVEGDPPVTDVGETEIELTDAASIVRVAFAEEP